MSARTRYPLADAAKAMRRPRKPVAPVSARIGWLMSGAPEIA